FTEAQAKIAAQQAKVLAAQQQAIETQLGQVAPDTEAARQLQAQLDLIKQKIANFNQQSAATAEDANRRDYERNASHASRIRSINEQIEDMERASQQARLKVLENTGVRREEIWNRQLQFDLQAEQIATSRRVAELQRSGAEVEWEISLDRFSTVRPAAMVSADCSERFRGSVGSSAAGRIRQARKWSVGCRYSKTCRFSSRQCPTGDWHGVRAPALRPRRRL